VARAGNTGIVIGLECEITLEATLPFLGGPRATYMDKISLYKCLG
jgi:hypothetical protein